MERFHSIGVIKNEANFDSDTLENFLKVIHNLRNRKVWTTAEIVQLFKKVIPEFDHKDTGKNLDGRM